MKTLIRRFIGGLSMFGASTVAMAGSVSSTDTFYDFWATVDQWAKGALGIGLAIVMLLIGAVFGIIRNSPLPALSGVALAAILHWGPGLIVDIMTNGAVI